MNTAWKVGGVAQEVRMPSLAGSVLVVSSLSKHTIFVLKHRAEVKEGSEWPCLAQAG